MASEELRRWEACLWRLWRQGVRRVWVDAAVIRAVYWEAWGRVWDGRPVAFYEMVVCPRAGGRG